MKFTLFQKTMTVLVLVLILAVACQGTPAVDPVQAYGPTVQTNGSQNTTNVPAQYFLLDEKDNIVGMFYTVDDGAGHLCRIVLSDGTRDGQATGAAIDCND